MKQTCQIATCFFIATLLDHIAHNTIVIVDQRYVANTIANAGSGGSIPADTIASEIININVPDCTNKVNNSHIQKKNRELIFIYSAKSTISVTNANQSFINENARKITQKLSINLLIVTTLSQRERKFIQIAPKKINGKAIIDTFKPNHTIPNIEPVNIAPTFDPRITANADANERIHVQTKANTSTETTFELSNIVVINTQLQKDFGTEDVNFFNKFLNHPLVAEETVCSK